MRHIFNTLDTTPDPSCAGKLADKAKYCGQLAKTVENTAGREADVETAMADRDAAVGERDTAKAEFKTAKDTALKLNPSIAPVEVTADTIEDILTHGQGKHKELKNYQAGFNPPIHKSCLDALIIVISKANELAVKVKNVKDKNKALKEKEELLTKNTNNIDRLTKLIAKQDKDMGGLNCGNADGCGDAPPSVNKRKSKKNKIEKRRRTK
jgi:hypothetical protein